MTGLRWLHLTLFTYFMNPRYKRRNCPQLQASSGGGGGNANVAIMEMLQKQAELFKQYTEAMLDGLFARMGSSE